MTYINRISSLRCGIFQNFKWPSELSEFGRYNLIYGWNGTGKTTLSRLFRDLELSRPPEMGEVVLRIDNHNVSGEDFAQSNVPVRVFNRDFVDDNVFSVERSEIPPILILGAENVEKQQKIEQLQKQHDQARADLNSARTNEHSTSVHLDQFCITHAKAIKETLRSSGDNPYNHYHKSGFQNDANQMVNNGVHGVHTIHSLSEAKREELRSRHRATPKPKVGKITYAFPDFQAITDRVSELLNTTVVSSVIGVLKDDPALAEWIRQGLVLHRDRSDKQCQFCEQQLPEERIVTLGAHFSDQYEQFIRNLEQKINELQTLVSISEKLQLPHKTDIYDDLGSEFESSKATLQEALESVQEWLAAAVRALEDKKQRVFEQVTPKIQFPQINPGTVEQLNKVIRKHNQDCDDFDARTSEARTQLANDMIAESLDEFVSYRNVEQDAKNSVQKKEKEAQYLQEEINRLEREIVEHRQPAEELVVDLRKYLGHDELCLEIKDTGYTITRSGAPAQSLSEGEKTAVALLYFLKSLNDRRFDMERGVIVLDDPVSSLDANALFLAFGFIRNRTTDAGQLFILTHNFSFFRQVRNWFHHLKGQQKKDPSQRPAQFFMLDSEFEKKLRNSVIQSLDPLLEQFESEYQYLFSRIYRASDGTRGLEQNYVLPNMARRLLEAFLAFHKPQIPGDLSRTLQSITFDEAKKLRILRFLHTYSHGIAIGDPEHDLTTLAEGPSVLKDLLEMIKSLDDKHYSAMVELINKHQSDE